MFTFDRFNYAALSVLTVLWVSPIQAQTATQSGSGPLKVNFVALSHFDAQDIKRAEGAADVLELVINSAEFRDKILNHTWKRKKQFADNDGLTNEQIYQKIMAAFETRYGKPNDGTIDLDLELYYSRKRVLGYTSPSTSKIYLNTKYFDYFDAVSLASNLAHEWTHKLGFDHDFRRTRRRPYSVPYAVGTIVHEVAEKLLGN